MSAKRVDLEVMTCVICHRTKAWTDGFPNRSDAICWNCAWDRHVQSAHWWQARKVRRRATRHARRVAVWGARAEAIEQLSADLIRRNDDNAK